MKIPILDLKEQYKGIKKEVDAAIHKVIDSQGFILGEDVKAFEAEVASYCNTKSAAGVASGTDALILALKALGIGPGDEVITSSFTFIATAEAISLVGAKPVFVDVNPRTYNIDPALIEPKISPATKAVIPVHLYGQCADMDPILAIAKRHNLRVIEDCAQAIGSTYKGRKAGSMGDMGAISFFPGKNLGAYGDAGMVVTNDQTLVDKVNILRVHGSSIRYLHSHIGMNSRLDSLQAAVLRVKLKYLDTWLEARREKARYYDEHLKGLPVTTPFVSKDSVHTYHLYVLRLRTGLEEFMKHLTDGGIETRTYYPVPLHLQECYKTLRYKKGDLPESEAAALETCAIAVYPELKQQDLEYVVKRIKGFFKG